MLFLSSYLLRYFLGPLAAQMAAMQKTISRQSPACPAAMPVVRDAALMTRASASKPHGKNLNQSGPNRSTDTGTFELY